MDTQQALAFTDQLLSGLITHLRSVPVGLRVSESLTLDYPELLDLEVTNTEKELSIAKETLSPPLFPDAASLDTDAFRQAVIDRVSAAFENLDGIIQSMAVSETLMKVTWKPDPRRPDFMNRIAEILKRGDYSSGILLLELFISGAPDDPDILYNLGMAYSDRDILDRAIALLSQLVQQDPDNTNGHVALGVALLRQGWDDEGIRELELAVDLSPDNLWACRNLGTGLIRLGRFEEAETHLLMATEIDPADQSSWYGYAQALEALGKLEDADQVYVRVIEQDEFSQFAELARKTRSKLAQKSFRSPPGVERMDAVMYCLSALQKFARLSIDQVYKIGFEIAFIGTRGLDVNSSEKKYTLKTLPSKYSTLQLLCLQCVAFKKFAPGQDIGFDLSSEYHTALELFDLDSDQS